MLVLRILAFFNNECGTLRRFFSKVMHNYIIKYFDVLKLGTT